MATGKANAFITALITGLFQNAAIGTLLAAGAAGSLYVSLHTADPGAAGSQTASEAAYTGYARVAVARTSAGFTVSGQTVTLTSNVTFPAGTGGGETITYIGIGTASSGVGQLLYRCTATPSLTTGAGITPIVSAGGTGIVES